MKVFLFEEEYFFFLLLFLLLKPAQSMIKLNSRECRKGRNNSIGFKGRIVKGISLSTGWRQANGTIRIRATRIRRNWKIISTWKTPCGSLSAPSCNRDPIYFPSKSGSAANLTKRPTQPQPTLHSRDNSETEAATVAAKRCNRICFASRNYYSRNYYSWKF